MGLIAKIKAEVEKKTHGERGYSSGDAECGYRDCARDILSFLNTIETKEVDLENSMVCEAKWHDGFLLDYTQEQQDALLEKIGANVGDKIRVILIKESATHE